MAHGRISLEQALNSDNFYQLPKVIIGTKYYSKLKGSYDGITDKLFDIIHHKGAFYYGN